MRLTFSIALAISGFFATTSVFAVNDTDDYGLNKITHDHNITMYKTGIQWALNSKTTLRAGFNHGEGVLSLSCATENIFSLDATEKVSKTDFINGVAVIEINNKKFEISNRQSPICNSDPQFPKAMN